MITIFEINYIEYWGAVQLGGDTVKRWTGWRSDASKLVGSAESGASKKKEDQRA